MVAVYFYSTALILLEAGALLLTLSSTAEVISRGRAFVMPQATQHLASQLLSSAAPNSQHHCRIAVIYSLKVNQHPPLTDGFSILVPTATSVSTPQKASFSDYSVSIMQSKSFRVNSTASNPSDIALARFDLRPTDCRNHPDFRN